MSSPAGSDDQKIKPPTKSYIRPEDVLCGRCKRSFNHVGNKQFREIVTNSIERYDLCENTTERALVVQAAIESIHRVGGRFLRKDPKENRWVELTSQQCRDKVGHAIRDASKNVFGSKKRKSLTGAMGGLKSDELSNDETQSKQSHKKNKSQAVGVEDFDVSEGNIHNISSPPIQNVNYESFQDMSASFQPHYSASIDSSTDALPSVFTNQMGLQQNLLLPSSRSNDMQVSLSPIDHSSSTPFFPRRHQFQDASQGHMRTDFSLLTSTNMSANQSFENQRQFQLLQQQVQRQQQQIQLETQHRYLEQQHMQLQQQKLQLQMQLRNQKSQQQRHSVGMDSLFAGQNQSRIDMITGLNPEVLNPNQIMSSADASFGFIPIAMSSMPANLMVNEHSQHEYQSSAIPHNTTQQARSATSHGNQSMQPQDETGMTGAMQSQSVTYNDPLDYDAEYDPLLTAINNALGPLSSEDSPENQNNRSMQL